MTESRLKTLYKDLFEGLASASVREGTAIVEELINPLVLINEPLFERVQDYLDVSALPTGLTSMDILEVIGARYLVEPRIGSKATVDVQFVFDAPREVRIPSTTVAYTQDRRLYRVGRSHVFAAEQLSELPSGFYGAPTVPMTADADGTGYAVEPGEVTVPGLTHTGLLYCTNPSASVGGAVPETEQEYYERIRLAITSRAMDTPLGLLAVASEEFSGEISRITLIGAGDQEMTRDQLFPYFRVRQSPLDIVVSLNRY